MKTDRKHAYCDDDRRANRPIGRQTDRLCLTLSGSYGLLGFKLIVLELADFSVL